MRRDVAHKVHHDDIAKFVHSMGFENGYPGQRDNLGRLVLDGLGGLAAAKLSEGERGARQGAFHAQRRRSPKTSARAG